MAPKKKLPRGRPAGENERNARGLTRKQHQVLRFIARCVIPPTNAEISDFLGLGFRSSGQAIRDQLYEMGFVIYNDKIPRSMRLTPEGTAAAKEPWRKINPKTSIH